MTSFFTLTVSRGASLPAAYSTPVAEMLPDVAFEKMMRVTVALGRMARFARGGSGSMYAERAYERVQFVGLMAEAAMNPPQPSPPFASGFMGIPTAARVFVQFPTTGTMLHVSQSVKATKIKWDK